MYRRAERVKRCGKSAPVAVATRSAVCLTGCKAKYILMVCRCCGTAGLPASFLTHKGVRRGRLQDPGSDVGAR